MKQLSYNKSTKAFSSRNSDPLARELSKLKSSKFIEDYRDEYSVTRKESDKGSYSVSVNVGGKIALLRVEYINGPFHIPYESIIYPIGYLDESNFNLPKLNSTLTNPLDGSFKSDLDAVIKANYK